jgi:hypothetical protein
VPSRQARPVPGLLAGTLLFDILINLPAFSAASPVVSLFAPSLDLLVALALLFVVSKAAPGYRTTLVAVVSLLLALMLGWEALDRFGLGEAARLLRQGPALRTAALVACALVALGAGGAAALFLSRLVLPGLADPVLRSVFLAAAAMCAVIQALTGLHVFSPSVIPKIVRALSSARG